MLMPALIVPAHADDIEVVQSLVSDIYLPSENYNIKIAAECNAKAVVGDLKELRQAIAEKDKKGETAGHRRAEEFVINVVVVCSCQQDAMAYATELVNEFNKASLGFETRGLVIKYAERLSEQSLEAAEQFRKQHRWVPVLLEQTNPQGIYVLPVNIEIVVKTILTLVVSATQVGEPALRRLFGDGTNRRYIRGAIVYDPAGEMLRAFRVAAADTLIPLVLGYLSDATRRSDDAAIAEHAKKIAEGLIKQLCDDNPLNEPTISEDTRFNTAKLRYFTQEPAKIAAYEAIKRDFTREMDTCIRQGYSAGQSASVAHRSNMIGINENLDRFVESVIERVMARDDAGALWPGYIGQIFRWLAESGGPCLLDAARHDWFNQQRKIHGGRLRGAIRWTEWPEVEKLEAATYFGPKWIVVLAALALAIAFLAIHFFIYEHRYLTYGALIATVVGLVYAFYAAVRFRLFRQAIAEKFRTSVARVRAFFRINSVEQYINLVSDGAQRIAEKFEKAHRKIGTLLTTLRSAAENQRKATTLRQHAEIEKLRTRFGDEAIDEVIKKCELEPDENRVDDVAAFVASRTDSGIFLKYLDDPDKFIEWIHRVVGIFVSEKKGLASTGALRIGGIFPRLLEDVHKRVEDGLLGYYREKGDHVAGVFFYPKDYESDVKETVRALEQLDIGSLAIGEIGRVGVISFYEVDVDVAN